MKESEHMRGFRQAARMYRLYGAGAINGWPAATDEDGDMVAVELIIHATDEKGKYIQGKSTTIRGKSIGEAFERALLWQAQHPHFFAAIKPKPRFKKKRRIRLPKRVK